MALTLTANLAAPVLLDPATRLTVTGTVPAGIDAGYRFRLEDELLELSHFGETEQAIAGGAGTQIVDNRSVWYVKRGVDGTAAVSHALGTAVEGVTDALVAGTDEVLPDRYAATPTLEAVLNAGNDTGGVAIVNAPVADVNAIAKLIATGLGTAQADATTNALAVDGPAIASITASTSGSGAAQAQVRATTVTASDADASSYAESLGGEANAYIKASTTNGADANAYTYARSVDGFADATVAATDAGSGDADSRVTASSVTGSATTGVRATVGANTAGVVAVADETSGRLGFNGTTPIAKPVIPATPNAQDIATVLVNLGLATQAAP